MSAALQIWSPIYCKAFDDLPPVVQQDVQRKVDDLGTRLATYSHHRLTGALNVGSVSETTALFTSSTSRRVVCSCTLLAIVVTFTEKGEPVREILLLGC